MSESKQGNAKRLPRYVLVLYGITGVALLVLVIAMISPRFADAYNRSVGAFFRAVLSHLTSWIPFSLAEMTLYAAIPAVVVLAVLGCRRYSDSWRSVLVYLGCILSFAGMVLSVFVLGFGTGHHTHTLDRRLDLPPVEVNAESLLQTAQSLCDQLVVLLPEITYGEDGFSQMPFDLRGLNDALLDAYEPVCERYSFVQRLNSRIKPVLASHAMSYLHITGVYSFYTGEANLNVYFPDYTLPFTAAHELAHQRGIARENEANFIAFLVCAESDDPYVRYSGYMNLLEYVINALYRTDEQLYMEFMRSLPDELKGEMRAYSAFFSEFRDSVAADISDVVNDTYLKLNGSEAGVASYGLVVELAVAYYQK